jgi:hypothetical protein
MDIAKYIGLFLLKNNFCYVPGIGNIEIKKKPALHDGQNLHAPAYEIMVTPGGSIDDTLANFIATNEKISIASASNAVRSFVTETKAALHEGKQITLPSLGHFVEENGKMQFVTDPAFRFTPTPTPTVKQIAKTHTQETVRPVTNRPAPTYNEKPKTGAGKIGVIVIISGLLLAGLVKGISYLYSKQETAAAAPADTIAPTVTKAVPPMAEPVVADTIAKKDTVTTVPAAIAPSTPGEEHIKVIIKTFNDRGKAEKSAHRLTTYGNTVEVIAKDSTTYYLTIPITVTAATKEHVLDSLRIFFAAKSVSIY